MIGTKRSTKIGVQIADSFPTSFLTENSMSGHYTKATPIIMIRVICLPKLKCGQSKLDNPQRITRGPQTEKHHETRATHE